MKIKEIAVFSGLILLAGLMSRCCKGSFEIPVTAYYAFVSNADGASISVIDVSNNSVIKTFDGSSIGTSFTEPRNLKVSHDGKMLYVPCRHTDDVLVVKVDSLQAIKMVEDTSFYEPYAVAFTADDAEVWAVNKKGGGSSTGSISIINTSSNTVVKSIYDSDLSSPEGIAIANGKAYITNRGDGSVSIFNINSRTLVNSINTGGEPRYAVASADEKYVYISNASGIRKIATDVDTIAASYPVYGRNPDISSDGQKLFVPNQWQYVYVINTGSGIIDTIKFSNASSIYGVGISSDGEIAYATDENRDFVYGFNPKTNAIINDNQGNPVEIPVGFTPRAISIN